MFCLEINLLMQFTESIAVCFGNRNVFAWGTMLQAGRSRVRVPVRSLNVFNLLNPSSRTMVVGVDSAWIEWVPGIFMKDKVRPARKADNLAAIYGPII
jgi:hypothetical protein